jgi:hypothetical protein
MRSSWLPVAVTLAILAVAPAASAGPDAVDPAVQSVARAAPSEPPSIISPLQPREITRVAAVSRPFLGLTGNSWGQIGDLRVEHYFSGPFMLGVELAPVALASGPEGMGAVVDARLVAAYVTRHLTLELGIGGRSQRFGAGGLSIAPSVRLGSLDGLSLSLTYTQTITRDESTGRPTIGFSNAISKLAVPLTRRLALELEGGFSLDGWAFGTVGLRYRLVGDGGPGTWIASGGFGAGMVVDRAGCNYAAAFPCGSSSGSIGPTMSIGIERRF